LTMFICIAQTLERIFTYALGALVIATAPRKSVTKKIVYGSDPSRY